MVLLSKSNFKQSVGVITIRVQTLCASTVAALLAYSHAMSKTKTTLQSKRQKRQRAAVDACHPKRRPLKLVHVRSCNKLCALFAYTRLRQMDNLHFRHDVIIFFMSSASYNTLKRHVMCVRFAVQIMHCLTSHPVWRCGRMCMRLP